MNPIFFTILPLILFGSKSFGQRSHEDSVSRNEADKIINQYFNPSITGNKVLLYSLQDRVYLILIEKSESIEEYYMETDSVRVESPLLVNKIPKRDKVLSTAFDTSIYHKNFVTNVDEATAKMGGLTYFVMKDLNNKRYGEYREAIIINPSPIPRKIYLYLFDRILELQLERLEQKGIISK